jgi:hypothetical protein
MGQVWLIDLRQKTISASFFFFCPPKEGIMFEKQRESLEASKNYQKAKLHVQTHKMAYACLGSAAVSGSVVTLLKSRPLNVTNVTNVMPKIAPIINNAPIFNNTVNNGGHMRKIVRCLETDELWTSVSKAAKAAEVAIPRMSQHLNGHKDQINGLHYVIEGLASG